MIALYILIGTFLVCTVTYMSVTIAAYHKTTYYKITHVSYFELWFDAGKYGEYQLYSYLKSFEKQGYRFLFNLYVPKENERTTEIDVLMITNKGIIVFESKNYKGWIFGEEGQKQWTQTLYGTRGHVPKEHFYNPILQNKIHIRFLKKIVGDNVPIFSVVAFSDRCELRSIYLPNGESQVVTYSCVNGVVSEMLDNCYYTMSDEVTNNLYSKLYSFSQVDEITKQKHIYDIRNDISNKTYDHVQQTQTGRIMCPQCGGYLVKRMAREGANAGREFYGCSNYPKCRYTKNISL